MIQEGKVFVDRRDAGYEVGMLLKERYQNQNVLVLGIPRGGVEVAYEVAKVLHGQLSVVVTKKLPHPLEEELAVGSVAEDGSVYLTNLGRSLRQETLDRIINEQWNEIRSRIDRFRKGAALPDMNGRVVIITDDGIATGSTIVPAIQLCRNNGAARIIIAAPVSGESFVDEIHTLADEIAIVEQPENFYAVGQVYEDFHGLTDDEVTTLLDDFERHTQ